MKGFAAKAGVVLMLITMSAVVSHAMYVPLLDLFGHGGIGHGHDRRQLAGDPTSST